MAFAPNLAISNVPEVNLAAETLGISASTRVEPAVTIPFWLTVTFG